MKSLQVWALIFASAFLCVSARARVVINEIFYHAPGDIHDLEYVELHNASEQAADLSGWKFTQGVKFQFPAGTKIVPRGYVVVGRNRERLREFFGAETIGTFEQSLKNGGERIELTNANGEKVDSVKFNNKAPWPVAPDGYSPSLERISPLAPSTIPQNWASSVLPDGGARPTGTPGKENSRYSENLPPIILNVKFTPPNPKPDQSVVVEADVEDADGLKEVKLLFRLAGPGFEKGESSVAMTKAGGKRFGGNIPGQQANQLIRFRVQAEDQKGGKRSYPDEQEIRPALSAFVNPGTDRSQISLLNIIHVDEAEFKAAQDRGGQSGGREISEEEQTRWMVWQQLRMGIDLPSAWFDLVFNQKLDFETVRKLQPIFARMKGDLDKLADKSTQLAGIREKIREVPKLVGTFHSDLREAVKPALTEGQLTKFTAWQNERIPKGPEAGMRWTPERMLQQIANMELAFFAATVQTNLNETQFAKLKTIYESGIQSRGKFAETANAASRGQGDWGKLHEELQTLDGKVSQQATVLLTREQQSRFVQGRNEMPPFAFGRGGGGKESKSVRGSSALVYVDPRTNEAKLLDYVTVRARKAGFNVDLYDDLPLNGMTGLNLVFEYKDRFVLAEHLAYELYRRAGCPAPASEFVRLSMDGRPLGYHLLIEQPNRAFLERNKIKPGGDMYKLLWFGRDIVGKHEKKNNPETGHDALIKLIEDLDRTQGDEQWAVIKKNFNVERVINYFAVNASLTHWDGFFNNYFTYHDTKGTGKWEMYPWDQDKTWGYHDSLRDDQIFWDMPIKYAHAGDEPPGRAGGRQVQGFNVGHWWRPPGYFSGPLLANPQFRKLYVARTKEMIETTYTPEIFFSIIDDLGKRLKQEVVIRAQAINDNTEAASKRLETNLLLLKEHLTKRREFLLKEEEVRMAGKFSRAALN